MLVNKLPKSGLSDFPEGIINSVDIESYQVELLGSQSISLSRENTLSPIADNIFSGNSESRSYHFSKRMLYLIGWGSVGSVGGEGRSKSRKNQY